MSHHDEMVKSRESLDCDHDFQSASDVVHTRCTKCGMAGIRSTAMICAHPYAAWDGANHGVTCITCGQHLTGAEAALYSSVQLLRRVGG